MKSLIPLILFLLFSCASTKKAPAPYACGPVMNQKGIRQTFQPIIDYMEFKPGDAFADVGASSGYFTVMMATLLTNTSFYIQDIDTACLNTDQLAKVIDYYARQSKKPLRSINSFHLIIGDATQTNLPESTLDKIYSNATFHCFTEPDKIVRDLYTRLKPDGSLYIRDSFTDKKGVQYCEDKKCARPLTKTEDFLAIMARNKFRVAKSKQFSGYPIYKFTKN